MAGSGGWSERRRRGEGGEVEVAGVQVSVDGREVSVEGGEEGWVPDGERLDRGECEG